MKALSFAILCALAGLLPSHAWGESAQRRGAAQPGSPLDAMFIEIRPATVRSETAIGEFLEGHIDSDALDAALSATPSATDVEAPRQELWMLAPGFYKKVMFAESQSDWKTVSERLSALQERIGRQEGLSSILISAEDRRRLKSSIASSWRRLQERGQFEAGLAAATLLADRQSRALRRGEKIVELRPRKAEPPPSAEAPSLTKVQPVLRKLDPRTPSYYQGMLYQLDPLTGRIRRGLRDYSGRSRIVVLDDVKGSAVRREIVPVLQSGVQDFGRLHQLPPDILAAGVAQLASARGIGEAEALAMIVRANTADPNNAAAIATLVSELDSIKGDLPLLKIDGSGTIELDDAGLPDRDSYILSRNAAKLLDADYDGVAVAGEDRILLERLKGVYDKTEARAFAGDNSLLRSVRYQERLPQISGGPQEELSLIEATPDAPNFVAPLLTYVRTERFRIGKWWIPSTEKSLRADRPYAEITAERSQSPFVKMLGKGARSVIYWAAEPDALGWSLRDNPRSGEPDALGLRMRVNLDAQNRERSLEMLAPIGKTLFGKTKWGGFYFEKIGDQWVPGRMDLRKDGLSCIQCHYSTDTLGRRSLSPRPAMLDTKAALHGVGYNDERLLVEYLRHFR